jgi:argininosuccinate lyase
MKEAIKMGFVDAAEVADYLILRGMNLRDAHGLVKSIMLYCEIKNKAIKDLELKELNQLSSVFDKSIYEYIEYDERLDKITH